MQNSNFSTPAPARKKIRKITLTAAIALGVLCFIIGLLFGGAFSSSSELESAQQKITELEFQLEETAAKNQELKDTYEGKINDLKKEKAELSEELGKAEEASQDADSDASATESGETKESSGSSKTLFVVILVILVIGCIGFAAYIILKKNRDDDEYDDEYDDDEEYDDEYDDEEYDDDEYDDEYDDDEYDDDEE